MKMRKLLSTVVAGAIAASAMITSASAAVTYNVLTPDTYMRTTFSGTLDFMESTFPVGTKATISYGWWGQGGVASAAGADTNGNETLDTSNYKIAMANLKINGQKVYEKEENDFNPIMVGGSKTVPLTFAMQSNDNKIAAGKRTTLTITCDLWITDADGNVDEDRSAQLAEYSDWTGFGMNVDILGDQEGIIVGASENYKAALNISGAVAKSGSYEQVSSVESTGDTYYLANSRPTLADQAVIKGSSAVLTLNLKKVTQVGFATVKVDSNDTIYVPITKGATSVSIAIPNEQVFDPAYGSLFAKIAYSVTQGTITGATITFDDGSAPAVTEDPAATEDPNAAEDDNDDDTDLTDDDDDDDDDIDVDFGDDDDNTDFGTGTVTTDDSNTATGDGSDAAGAGTVSSGDTTATGSNPKTGVAVAVIPAIVAAAAVVVARKRK